MKPSNTQPVPILIADDNRNFRKLITEVLRDAGFSRAHHATDGQSLLRLTMEVKPRIVITASRLPAMSGLEFTRLVRSGHGGVNPSLSIIVMTTTPTLAFLAAARESGVDEMLACPFAPAALLARIEAVLVRPRRLIKSPSYIGPCRRRRMLQDYGGELRRESDPIKIAESAPWEAEANRELVRRTVNAISEHACGLAPGDHARLTALNTAAKEAEELAEEIEDVPLAGAAKSLERYIAGMRASQGIDPDVIAAHIDAMQSLATLSSAQQLERQSLIDGLVTAVDKRLGGHA